MNWYARSAVSPRLSLPVAPAVNSLRLPSGRSGVTVSAGAAPPWYRYPPRNVHLASFIHSAAKRKPLVPSYRSNNFRLRDAKWTFRGGRSEEHTSELQSLAYLVCRLLLEKKKKKKLQ